MSEELYTEQLKNVEYAIQKVIGSLSGEDEMICYDTEPSRKYSIGILTPLFNDDEITNNSSNNLETKRKPGSIGFEIRIKKTESKIKINFNLKFSLYYRSIPNYKEQLSRLKYKELNELLTSEEEGYYRLKYIKKDIQLNNLLLEIEPTKNQGKVILDTEQITNQINGELEKLSNEIFRFKDCWIDASKDPKIKNKTLVNEEIYEQNLYSYPKKAPKWKVKISSNLWMLNSGDIKVNLLISNISTEPSPHAKELFNVKIDAGIQNGEILPVSFKAAAIDYRYKSQGWGKGINCFVEVSNNKQNIRTQTVPIFKQKRITSRTAAKESCKFAKLSEANFEVELKKIEHWLNEYADIWTKDNGRYINSLDYEQRKKDLDLFNQEIMRFKLGIKAIQTDERLSKAFVLMNKVFLSVSKEGYDSWRLFQLVFIVTQLSSLIAREKSDEIFRKELEKVDVLWFPTGGGKTEAYFGVILTALFYDRLRGKSFGTTAWLRYPLRMLSIQQLQRLVNVIVAANKVKGLSGIPNLINSQQFSVGFYAGSTNTPNFLTKQSRNKEEALEPILEIKSDIENASSTNEIKYLVLQYCPFCASKNITLLADVNTLRLKHICKDCKSEAPIYISDSEIYRYAPSVIVGTVDRLARAGETSLFAHIFNRYTKECPDHGFVSFDRCIEKVCTRKQSEYKLINTLADPCPSLLLQDELHLLKESLGTYDSHYEGFIDVLSTKIGNSLPPKRIAATATIEGFENHISELYAREAIRFPVKGMDVNDTAYIEASDEVSRIYVGIMPTGSVMDDVITDIPATLNSILTDPKKQISQSIIDNFDLNLIYVNEKNTAGNLGEKLNQNFSTSVLTGDKGLSEVRTTISRVEHDPKVSFDERLKLIIATSIISHGVDLERLNYMVFYGMPNHVADYIQASSRVGRKHIGVVFTVFRTINNRERNIYQRFYEFHERLNQLVLPIPVNRLSESSLKRTFTGILSSTVLNIIAYDLYPSLEYSVENANNYIKAFKEGYIKKEYLINLLVDIYGLKKFALEDSTVDLFVNLLKEQIEIQERLINLGEDKLLFRRFKPSPVSSLREVNEQVEFTTISSEFSLVKKLVEGRIKK